MISVSHACILLMYCPILCFAWGFKGHQAIAQIAEQHLTSTTKIALQPIQYKTTFEQLSIWPDTIRRSTPLTTHWHYVTLSTQQWPALPLKNQGQLYTALCQQMKILTDDQSIHWQDRHQALSWVIHLVGDAHQPLHINQGQDQGGNRCTVRWLTRKKLINLHKVWDTLLVKETLKLNPQLRIKHPITHDDLIQPPLQWLYAGRAVHSIIYPKNPNTYCNKTRNVPFQPPKLDRPYIHQMIPIVTRQLQLSGQRLAYLLNQAFDPKFRATHPSSLPWIHCHLNFIKKP
jgi:hypothetical protein